jgi:predicted DsbA family dithiol-disulfide isomerase
VSRSDVVFELAERAGLDMHRFASAYQSRSVERTVLDGYQLAAQRGVHSAPTLVIDGRWMVSGLRSLSEYREILLQCLEKTSMSGTGTEDLFH